MGLGVGFVTHAFRQDAALAPWDGAWHLIAFAVPESARAGRDALRAALTFLGGAAVHGGLYLSPDPWEPYVIAGRYDRLAAVAEPRLRALKDHPEQLEPRRLTIAVEPAAEFTRAMEADPLLPPELLPRPWSGARARTLTARCWSLLEERTGEDDGDIRLFSLYGGLSRLAAGA
uniref:PaaX family transcriptional regulator C-terminal domain-containing protein n=1 Tax=Nonomuraea pusilla TaxID=46177 RepID=UPI0006E2C810|nr:PaaX family transcriptional regulator C-terminal domain-containing protein [Nonomuraea pusilla]